MRFRFETPTVISDCSSQNIQINLSIESKTLHKSDLNWSTFMVVAK